MNFILDYGFVFSEIILGILGVIGLIYSLAESKIRYIIPSILCFELFIFWCYLYNTSNIDYEISNSLVNLLISRVGTNLEILNQEVNKIKIYKDKDLIITEDDIINLTSKNIESDMFALINYIVNKDKYNALLVYHELIKNNEEPVVMLINLSNKLRMIYQVKIFMKKGYSEADIAKILDVKPGALYYMRDSLRKYDEKRLIFLLEKLKELDYKIKTNSIDRFLGFELFILEN